jgi:hypothetical protein
MSLAYHPAGIGFAGVALATFLVPAQTQRLYAATSRQWAALPLILRIALGAGFVVAAWVWNLQRVIPN